MLQIPIEGDTAQSKAFKLSNDEKAVLAVFQERHLHIDEIIGNQMTSQQVIAILLMLELKGVCSNCQGKCLSKHVKSIIHINFYPPQVDWLAKLQFLYTPGLA